MTGRSNFAGVVSGIAQTAAPDPLGEHWSCSIFFPAATRIGHQCLGFRWQNGVMSDDDFIISANDIDDDGRITGQAVDLATGAFVAFIAVPTSD